MFLSKLWYLVLALVAAAAAAVALMAPRPAAREIREAHALGLDRVQHNAELMLRLQARDWIDAAAGMARDRTLVEVLEAATDKKSDVAQLKARATDRLLSLTSGLDKGRRPELMIVTDADGMQLTRVGPGEDKITPGKDGIGGYPLVEAALRGYRRDDTWSLDNKLYMMVASPVISRGKGRYVGALLLGREVNKKYAQRFKARLGGADVVFFLRGSIVASTVTNAALTKLPLQFADKRRQIDKDGRSAALRVGQGGSAQTLIMAPLPGEASAHDAFYAVVTAKLPPQGLGTTLSLLNSDDLSWGNFPWLLLGGGFLLALVVGLGLMVVEADLPLRRMLRRTAELGRGEMARLPDKQFSGKMGSVARNINVALDKAEKRSSSAPASKDLSKILGSPEEHGTRPDLRLDPAFSSMPPMAGVKPLSTVGASIDLDASPAGKPPPAMEVQVSRAGEQVLDLNDQRGAAAAKDGPSSAAPKKPAADEGSGGFTPLAGLGPGESEAEEAATEVQSESPFPLPPPAPGSDAASSFSGEPSLGGGHAPEDRPSSRGVRIPESEQEPQARAHSTLPPLDPKAVEALREQEGAPPEVAAAPPADEDAATTRARSPEEDELEQYFDQIYKSFVSIKRQCGESIENLTYERFANKLRKNRAALLQRYKCKSVKFQVYIKDGKAAIKATPIKE